MASKSVTITRVTVAIDVIQDAVPLQSLFDYLKTNYKKEVVVINAADFTESSGARPSKSEPRSSQLRPSHYSRIIVRGLRQRIDSEISKALEAKKRLIAHLEKQKAAAATTSKTQKPRSRHRLVDEPPKFQGKIDVLFIIQNFPYLPSQLRLLIDGGVGFDSFIAIVPASGAEQNPFDVESLKSARQSQAPAASSKFSRAASPASVKRPVPGSCLESTTNLQCYPPPRWMAMQATAPFPVSFLEIRAADTIEGLVRSLEEEIFKILARKPLLAEFVSGRRFVSLPSVVPRRDISAFQEYLNHYSDDWVSALIFQLKSSGWRTVDPRPPPNAKEEYIELFQTLTLTNDRRYVAAPPGESLDRIFPINAFPSIYPILYKMKRCQILPERAQHTIAFSRFVADRTNFHAYVGQKFDQMFAMINKKYQLGLPIAFFDWQKWNLSIDYINVSESLAAALDGSRLAEATPDDDLQMTYVFLMPQFPRSIGSCLSKSWMPPTIAGCNEWLDNLADVDTTAIKRSRAPPTPASLLKSNSSLRVLLPSLSSRYDSKEKNVYRLPISVSDSMEFITPYFLEPDLEVRIFRELLQDVPKFRFSATARGTLRIESADDTLSMVCSREFRVFVNFPFTVSFAFDDRTITFDGDHLLLKLANVAAPSLITREGHLIMSSALGETLSLMSDGTTGQRDSSGRWIYMRASGESFQSFEGKTTKLSLKHAIAVHSQSGLTKMIRPDEVDFITDINGVRTIILFSEYSVVQEPNGTVHLSVQDFPEVHCRGGNFELAFKDISVQISEKIVQILGDGFKIVVGLNAVDFAIGETEGHFSPSHCEFKAKNRVLYAASDGTERMGELSDAPPKSKKIEPIQTRWGTLLPLSRPNLNEQEHIALLQRFQPRFFVICRDMSGVEFFRSDALNTAGTEEQVHDLDYGACHLTAYSYHTPHGEPICYVKTPALSKLERGNLLRAITVEKPTKKAGEEPEDRELVEQAGNAINEYLTDYRAFVNSVNARLDAWHADYMQGIRPPTPPPPEKLTVPPHTPLPRRLTAARDAHTDPGQKNYWLSHESDFGHPLHEQRKDPRQPSPGAALFDPPGFFKPAKSDGQRPKKTFVTQKTPSSRASRRTTMSSLSGVEVVSAGHEAIDFGEPRVGSRCVKSLRVPSQSMRPLRFRVDHIQNPMVRVVNPRGVMTPGLPQLVRIELNASKEGVVAESLEFRTPNFHMSVPLRAAIRRHAEPQDVVSGERADSQVV
jgi:hypothetical protein